MQSVKFIDWEEDTAWIGYLPDYPDYWTQRNTLDDLKAHWADLFHGLTSGQLAAIQRVGELTVS